MIKNYLRVPLLKKKIKISENSLLHKNNGKSSKIVRTDFYRTLKTNERIAETRGVFVQEKQQNSVP